jgi:hypothetical protein
LDCHCARRREIQRGFRGVQRDTHQLASSAREGYVASVRPTSIRGRWRK